MHEIIDMQDEPTIEDTLLTSEQRAYLAGFKTKERDIAEDKAVRWEALREQVNTIGARDVLNLAVAKLEGREG